MTVIRPESTARSPFALHATLSVKHQEGTNVRTLEMPCVATEQTEAAKKSQLPHFLCVLGCATFPPAFSSHGVRTWPAGQGTERVGPVHVQLLRPWPVPCGWLPVKFPFSFSIHFLFISKPD